MKDKAYNKTLSMSLTRMERSELLIEAIITVSLTFLLYLSALLLYRHAIDYKLTIIGLDTTLRHMLGLTYQQIMVSVYLFSFISIIVAIVLTHWRVQRRVKQMKLAHVLEYLKYIAQGHYDIRIPETDIGDMTDVIMNINHLVESTVTAMEEERRIEKTKDELITNIGHDLRTPLTSIIGYLGLIENKQFQSEQELLQYTHTAYTKAKHMQVLVNDLFDYTASRQINYTSNISTVQAALFLDQIAADFELNATQQQMELIVEVQPKDLQVTFDVDKMARVFHNLLSNAFKYGVGAKKIILSAHVEAASATQQTVVFKVANDGQLLREDELEAIFQRSYRADQSRSSDQLGSGLGLAIVRNIVELHKGKVYAMIQGQQTVFVIELPQTLEDKKGKDAL